MKQKAELYSFQAVEGNTARKNVPKDAETAEIQMISLNELHDFEGHPFKVMQDMALLELMESIKSEGVIVPALARPKKERSGYELIAGHRRKAACKLAGISEMPVIVKEPKST